MATLRSIYAKILILLLAVAAVSLLAAVLLRDLMVRDFRSFREGEMEDRVYWVSAELEHAYGAGGWSPTTVREEAVRALMLGLETRVLDRQGQLVADTASALAALPEARRERVLTVSRYQQRPDANGFVPYPLFVAGAEIGSLEVRFLPVDREERFILRSNRLLLGSAIAVGVTVLVLGILAARRLTRPLQSLAGGVDAIGRGELGVRVPVTGHDEVARVGQAFNRMAETLERQEKLRKQLFANAAHELRTPLAAMRGELEGMLDGLLPSTPEQLRSLHEETGRLTGLVKGMEELLQAEASVLSLQLQPVVLHAFLVGIADRYRSLAREAGVELLVTGDATLAVTADPERLGQIVVNLLANALRATPAGGRVTLTVARDRDAGMLTVADTGCGIAAEELPQIFERFYRGRTGGLGIGLAIVQELVAAHGGNVAVTSTPDVGTVFTIRLPLAEN
jgi:two-component system sensor histidine kinase BaeS